jgi:hypothetical protein
MPGSQTFARGRGAEFLGLVDRGAAVNPGTFTRVWFCLDQASVKFESLCLRKAPVAVCEDHRLMLQLEMFNLTGPEVGRPPAP